MSGQSTDHWKQRIIEADNVGNQPDWGAIMGCQIYELFKNLPVQEGLTALATCHRLPHGARFTVRQVRAKLDTYVEQGRFHHDGETFGRKYFMD